MYGSTGISKEVMSAEGDEEMGRLPLWGGVAVQRKAGEDGSDTADAESPYCALLGRVSVSNER